MCGPAGRNDMTFSAISGLLYLLDLLGLKTFDRLTFKAKAMVQFLYIGCSDVNKFDSVYGRGRPISGRHVVGHCRVSSVANVNRWLRLAFDAQRIRAANSEGQPQ